MRVVVTGNMGCGKSTVVQILQELLPEHQLFDFDKMVHGLYEDPSIQMALFMVFGITDRRLISDIVHADQKQMEKLERIMNSEILKQSIIAFNTYNIILDVPLYYEYLANRPEFTCDDVICVTCSPNMQRNRIRSRNGFSDQKIDSILSKQLVQEEKARRSTFVINNDGTIDDLRQQVLSFVQKRST